MDEPVLRAYEIYGPVDGLEIVPAHPQRDWMNASVMEHQPDPNKVEIGHANRCLPLLMANQIGWNIVNKIPFMVTSMPDGHMLYHWEHGQARVGAPRNNFRFENMLTWPLPWTFETPPGWDLLLMPPPNVRLPVGVNALTALVETDHVAASFTYNWHVPPQTSIWVEAGAIVCRLLPYQTGELEKFGFEIVHNQHPDYAEWQSDRTAAMQRSIKPPYVWERSYFKVAKRLKIKRRS